MEQNDQNTQADHDLENIPDQNSENPGTPDFSNAVLKRLIAEVQFENANNITAYNRTHNRHNRGR
jgi:hypothetical protein